MSQENEKQIVKEEEEVVEHKQLSFSIKAFDETDKEYHYLSGLASPFGNIDEGDDVVVAGAFQASLKASTPVILWQHNMESPIGVPVIIEERAEGLWLEAKMPKDDSLVSGRVAPQLRCGSVKNLSIGYTVQEFTIKDGIRYIEKARLFEVSLVTFGMNSHAKITSFKSKDGKETEVLTIEAFDKMKEVKEISEYLSGLGVFSKSTTTAITSAIISHKSLGKPSKDDLGKPDNDMSKLIANINEFNKELDN